MAASRSGTAGTVGGGTMELILLRTASEMLERGRPGPELVEHLHSEGSSGVASPSGMICSGSQLTAVLTVGAGSLADLELAGNLLAGSGQGTLRLDPLGLRISGDPWSGPPAFERTEEDGWSFVSLLGLEDTVYIVGGGHVGRALAELLAKLPFRPVIIDERPSPSEELPYEWIRSPYIRSHRLIPPGDHSWAVVMTPSHGADGEVLENLAGLDLRYVGLMASRAKRESLYARLREAGVSGEWLGRVRSPIGLPIGGRSPWEIAVSAAAQLISEKYGK